VGARRTREREDARKRMPVAKRRGPGEDGGERTQLDGAMCRRKAGRRRIDQAQGGAWPRELPATPARLQAGVVWGASWRYAPRASGIGARTGGKICRRTEAGLHDRGHERHPLNWGTRILRS